MKNTYFVFIDPLYTNENHRDLTLDGKVKFAFDRLKNSQPQNVEVIYLSMGEEIDEDKYPGFPPYFALRLMRDHGIDELPAFICTTEEYRDTFRKCNVENLRNRPIMMMLLGALTFTKAKGSEQKGIHVSRTLIETYDENTDTLFCFIRDINSRLCTRGINSAGNMVYQELIKIKGKKFAKSSSTIIKGF